MPKVILISQFPLPYHNVSSWPNMYNKYFETNHQIDYIVCEQPKTLFSNVKYSFAKNDLLTKIRRKLLKYYRIGYIDALFKIIDNSNEKFIIQVVDNHKIVFKINEFLLKKGIKDRVYIHAFYHGYSPFLPFNTTRDFYEIIDELTLLTITSYKEHLKYYGIFPCKVSILYNGIDTQKFHKFDVHEKEKLKEIAGYQNKKLFIWCSRDQPKKGLKFILDVWKKVYSNNKEIHLIVIGNKNKYTVDGVTFFGRIPNDDLPKYYQMADCYLFPTLCHEGFGLSLAEALNCGCYCITSKIGGVPEVLQFGKYGKLIENPNFISEWETAINNYINGIEQPIIIEKELYTIQDWITNMNHLIEQSKISLS